MTYKEFANFPITLTEPDARPEMYDAPFFIHGTTSIMVDAWRSPAKCFVLFGDYERGMVEEAINMAHFFSFFEIVKVQSVRQIIDCLAEFHALDHSELMIIVGVPRALIIDMCEAGAGGVAQNVYLILCTSELTVQDALYEQLTHHEKVNTCFRLTAHGLCLGKLYSAWNYTHSRGASLLSLHSRLRAELQSFRYNDFKYIHSITGPVRRWFMRMSDDMFEPMLVERVMLFVLNANEHYRRNVKSGISRAAVKHASRCNWD